MTSCSLSSTVCTGFPPLSHEVYLNKYMQVDLVHTSRSICLPCWFVCSIYRSSQLRLSAESICLDPFIQQPACCLVCLLECLILSACISIEPVSLCHNACLWCLQADTMQTSSSNSVHNYSHDALFTYTFEVCVYLLWCSGMPSENHSSFGAVT